MDDPVSFLKPNTLNGRGWTPTPVILTRRIGFPSGLCFSNVTPSNGF